MTESGEIQVWLDRLQEGDESARARLVALAETRFRRLAHYMLEDFPEEAQEQETDDILQNALLRLWKALAEGKPPTVLHFRRLMALQIRRELLELARRLPSVLRQAGPLQGGGQGGSESTRPSNPGPVAPSSCDPGRQSLWTEFHEQIDHMPENERVVFELLYYEEVPQQEAADLLSVSVGTIRLRWYSAQKWLRDRLGDIPGVPA